MRRYNEKIVSSLIGIALAIPLVVVAHNNRTVQEIPTYEPEKEYIEEPKIEVEYPKISVEEVPIVKESSSSIHHIEEDPVEEEIIEEETVSKESLGTFIVTAYCACSKCCGKYADGYTATGTVATEGRTIAVDPDVIPLGSVIEFNGKEYIAEDTGVDGRKIDLFIDSHTEARIWGVQEHEIFIVGGL